MEMVLPPRMALRESKGSTNNYLTMKQTFTKESIILHEGGNLTFYGLEEGETEILASTNIHVAEANKCPHLDRKAFVKPVDVSKLAHKSAELCYGNVDLGDYRYGFKAGYAANPNEFTREDMIQAVKYGAAYVDVNSMGSMDELDKQASDFIDTLQPISIPSSVTIENNQVIEVIWT